MHRPNSLWDQHVGRTMAELARGCGRWPAQPYPCDLEPPWRPLDRDVLDSWACFFNAWEGPWEGNFFLRLLPTRPLYRLGSPLLLPEASWGASWDEVVPIVIEQFPGDEESIFKGEQFLRSLSATSRPVSFEVIGLGPQPEWDHERFRELYNANEDLAGAIIGWTTPGTFIQLVAHRHDAALVRSQLLANNPNSGVVIGTGLDYHRDLLPAQDLKEGIGFAAAVSLGEFYCFPVRMFSSLDPDPIAVPLAAMERLGREDWALVQVLFEPARHPWGHNVRQAIEDPYKPGKSLFTDISERQLKEKFSSGPLFSVAVRVAAKRQGVFKQLLGWVEQFAADPQRFVLVDDDVEDLAWAIEARCTFRPGMVLSVRELAGLVHLPSVSVVSERLQRVKTRTRPVAATSGEPGSVVLGENIHQGRRRLARIPAALRPWHFYVAGSSGTGKSTLLLNCIIKDLANGEGAAVLDPHGDLVRAVLRRIPAHRLRDVILFDPADENFPTSLNILEARDEHERERIVAETVMALEKFFPTSWGPRLERILTFAIHSVLVAIPGATLADVERMLTETEFQREVISKLTDPRLRSFWKTQFPFMPKNSADPVLNKLSPFLVSRLVRNIICQRRSSIDFDQVLNQGKVLLCNLSSGLLTEKISGVFGSFLVTKIVNAGFRRARMPEHKRRSFYLYIDEFQNFMNLSIGFERVLAEARKYRLILTMANQYVAQLSLPVRHAIFGNVGTLATFRLGVDDAQVVAKEMGVFTPEEILNLELGQAIVRVGGSSTAFNLTTYPEPPLPEIDPTDEIIARCRKRYARPRSEVEQEIGDFGDVTERLERAAPHGEEPPDLADDDLVR